MKKTYQNPEIKIVKVQMAQMIAASIGFGEDVTDASKADARRGGGFWDDEEE